MIINDKGQDFRTKYNVDRIKHPDSEIVKIYGKDFKLGDVRAACAMYNERLSDMTIFYDNVFQYTSIGLMDLVFEKFNIPSNIPIKEFMNRTVLADKFVKSICKLWGVSEQDVDNIERDCYIEILKRSPFTKNTEAYLLMRRFLNTQRFVFKYQCPEMASVLNELKRGFGQNAEMRFTSVEMDYLNGSSIKTYLKHMPDVKKHCLEIIAVEDAGTICSFFDEHGCAGSNIITFLNHNGLTPDHLLQIVKNDGYGFENYIVNFIEEGIAYAT